MEQNIRKALQTLRCEPDCNLSENIWHTVCSRRKRTERFTFALYSLAGLACLAGLVPAVTKLASDFSQSGFYDYLSLLSSDSGSVLSSWKEFMYSLLESLPIASILLSLGLLFVFFLTVFLAIKYAMKHIINNQPSLFFRT